MCSGLIIFILVSFAFSFPQSSAKRQPDSQTREKKPTDIWFERAEYLTWDIIKDANDLQPFDRALLWAKLAQAWEDTNKGRSREWMKKSVEIVEDRPLQEDSITRQKRIAAAHALFPIIAPIDWKLGERLTTILVEDADKLSDADRKKNGDTLAKAAQIIVEKDPKRAAQLASASIRAGSTLSLRLLWDIKKHDFAQAMSLFNEALERAQSTNDIRLLSALAQSIYISQGADRKQLLPDDACTKVLALMAAWITRVPASPQDQTNSCRLAPLAADLLPEFDRLLPQQSVAVRLASAICQDSLPSGARAEVAEQTGDQPLKTSDDFLNAADRAADSFRRSVYILRAANSAVQQKDYDRALFILDNRKSSMHEQHLGAWNDARREWASLSALEYLKRKDFQMMRKAIADTPIHLRCHVALRVSEKLADDRDPSAIELLQEARSLLDKADLSESLYSYLLHLTILYAKVMPAETMSVFNEAVKAINRAERLKSRDSANEADWSWLSSSLPLSVLTGDEIGARDALSSIEPRMTRIGLRYGLLRATLEKHRAVSKEEATKSKGQGDVRQ